jgi:hypothetical protein
MYLYVVQIEGGRIVDRSERNGIRSCSKDVEGGITSRCTRIYKVEQQSADILYSLGLGGGV